MTGRRLLLLLLLAACLGLPAAVQGASPALPGPPAGLGRLHDISEPVPLPERSRPIALAAVGLAAALLAGLGLAWLRRRRPSRRQAVLQAHETALLRLAEAEGMIDEGHAAAFVALVDQALRRYLEERFGAAAPRQTTREFIGRLAEGREGAALKERSDSLKAWLESCDRVKFAGAGLSRQSMAEMTAELREFVQATSREAERA